MRLADRALATESLTEAEALAAALPSTEQTAVAGDLAHATEVVESFLFRFSAGRTDDPSSCLGGNEGLPAEDN